LRRQKAKQKPRNTRNTRKGASDDLRISGLSARPRDAACWTLHSESDTFPIATHVSVYPFRAFRIFCGLKKAIRAAKICPHTQDEQERAGHADVYSNVWIAWMAQAFGIRLPAFIWHNCAIGRSGGYALTSEKGRHLLISIIKVFQMPRPGNGRRQAPRTGNAADGLEGVDRKARKREGTLRRTVS
jgi:hypothetical protein